jgi:hypothetical protein
MNIPTEADQATQRARPEMSQIPIANSHSAARNCTNGVAKQPIRGTAETPIPLNFKTEVAIRIQPTKMQTTFQSRMWAIDRVCFGKASAFDR